VGDHAAARALLEAGANPDLRQRGGYTALHTAAHNDDAELARLLLSHGADPAVLTDDGQTAADMAGEATRELF
jgi:ankyrin repeat protein